MYWKRERDSAGPDDAAGDRGIGDFTLTMVLGIGVDYDR